MNGEEKVVGFENGLRTAMFTFTKNIFQSMSSSVQSFLKEDLELHTKEVP